MRLILSVLLTLNLLHAQKIALLIGNDDYSFSPLANPLNDVDGIYKTLKEIGFDISQKDVLKNASQDKMQRALASFSQRAKDAEVALIYFSGHGMQVNNTNYMLPAKTNPKKPVDLFGLVDLDYFIQSATSAKYGIVLVDACRDNPLVKYFQNGKHKGISAKKGLGQVTPTAGQVVIGFATSAGDTADDGNGDMSPYARALSNRLKENDDIRNILGKVAQDVSDKHEQNPIYRGNLASSVFLNKSIDNIDTSTPESFAKLILRSFSENNKNIFTSTVVVKKSILKKFLPPNLHNDVLPEYNKFKKNVFDSWDKIYIEASRVGIDWNEISNIYTKYNIRKDENKIETTDIYVFFTSQNKQFRFKLDDCAKINKNWYTFDNMTWKGEVINK